MLGRADAGEHQKLRRIEGRGRDDDLPVGTDHLDLAAALDLHADGPAVLDHHAPGKAAHQRGVGPLQRRLQIGVCRRPAPAIVDGLLHQAEAFLLGAVIVVRQLEPGLLAGIEEGVEQRIGHRPALHMQRPVGAAPALFAAGGGFHALEIGQHVLIAPAARAKLFPAVEVFRMAPHIDEPVDGGGAADHLAARRGDAPVVEMRLGLGQIAPVVALHAHRPGQRRRHLDERPDIRPAIFQHHDGVLAVLGQSIGESRTGGAGADDDVVCLVHGVRSLVGRGIVFAIIAAMNIRYEVRETSPQGLDRMQPSEKPLSLKTRCLRARRARGCEETEGQPALRIRVGDDRILIDDKETSSWWSMSARAVVSTRIE